ncbi:MAG: hypothetical protein DKM50_00130 [Candidatus Margulisiibacteriota bacterium]|nr:MAG: hypothetical protein A2X41_09610 [Candidatus Margulisbacteria bacterium GWE2_39_32]PZM84943.1 MAG: hypothetical protein DKM50_00130 [Candidatus Margulisiibacteriota bacterium]HCT86107.1 hypothetical protein [Candidatus Margulisiibacteriota bacterium]HCY36871.1 hypothetical protein [Candidatus Margulisiibacteriota bacterium]
MIIDMHNHTDKYSSCSILDSLVLVEKAEEKKLDGIIITEHYYVWTEKEIRQLKAMADSHLVILRAQEVATSIGDLLCIGYYENLPRKLSAMEVIRRVHGNGGVVIMAHPFRGGKDLGANLQKLSKRFAIVDGIEVYNGNQVEIENQFGYEVWESLNIVGIGGSDSHSAQMVGKYVTEFENYINNEDDLVRELKAGKCKPVIHSFK